MAKRERLNIRNIFELWEVVTDTLCLLKGLNIQFKLYRHTYSGLPLYRTFKTQRHMFEKWYSKGPGSVGLGLRRVGSRRPKI